VPDAVLRERRPVDRGRQRLHRHPGHLPDQPLADTGLLQRRDHRALVHLHLASQRDARASLPLRRLVAPRDDHQVAGTGVQRRGPRKQQVAERVTDLADAELVETPLVAEQADQLAHPPLIFTRAVQPRQTRPHTAPPSRQDYADVATTDDGHMTKPELDQLQVTHMLVQSVARECRRPVWEEAAKRSDGNSSLDAEVAWRSLARPDSNMATSAMVARLSSGRLRVRRLNVDWWRQQQVDSLLEWLDVELPAHAARRRCLTSV
jgi:hypothetical protein